MQETAPTASPATPAVDTAGMGNRAVRNTVLVLAARIASRVLALITVIAIGNSLGDTGFGELQTAVTYGALIAVLVDLGFNVLYMREGARHPEMIERYLDNVLSVKLLLSAVGLLFIVLALQIPDLGELIAPAFALMLAGAYANLLRNTFYALQRLFHEAVTIVTESALLLGLTLVGIQAHRGVAYFLWAYAASYASTCLYIAVVLSVKRVARIRWRFDAWLLRAWFVIGLPLAFTYVMTNIYFKVDVPILQQFRPYDEVGWYTLAYKPFEALLFIPMTVRTVLFPVMAVFHGDESDRMMRTADRLFKALVVLGLPMAVGLAVLSPGINSILHLFPESQAALQILAVGIVLIFVDNTFISALNAMNRQLLYASIPATGLVVNVVLNLVLIPRFGYLAAAWNTVITEAVMVAMGWAMLARLARPVPVLRLSWRVAVASAVMGLALWPMRDLYGPKGSLVIAAVLMGTAVYVLVLVAIRGVGREELDIVRGALRRR